MHSVSESQRPANMHSSERLSHFDCKTRCFLEQATTALLMSLFRQDRQDHHLRKPDAKIKHPKQQRRQSPAPLAPVS
jgi:hypothetical protein